jgi:hypothetical protein
MMVLVYEVFAHYVGFGAGTVVHGVGEITAKENMTAESGAAVIRFEVELPVAGGVQRGEITVPESYGSGLATGDRVGVLYRHFGEGVRLEQIGAVALPKSGE